MTFTIRWYLAGLAAVSLTAAAASQSVPPDVRGIYTGTYVCNQRQFGLQLSFEPRSATQLSVVVAFFTPGTDASQPLGAFRTDGTFDPASGALRMQPTSWVKRAVTFTMFGFSGTHDAASGRIKGTIQAPGCTGFDAVRDEQASRRLAAAAVAREAEFANAPTSYAAARNPGEQCLVIGKWYSRFKKEHPAIDILRSMGDELSRHAMNLFMDEEFSPVFGKTFDKMTDAERRPIALTIRTCASQLTDRGDLFMYQNPLQRPFSGAAVAADVVSQLAYRRTLRQQRQQLLKELPSLPGTDVSLDRVTALRDSELKEFAILWPSEHRELTDALDAAATRIASPVVERWVDGVLSGASGYQGLTAVMTAQSRLAAPRPNPPSVGMAARGAPVPSRSSAPVSGPSDDYLAMIGDDARQRSAEKLRVKAEALVRELAAAEKSKLAGLGTGLAALQAGTAWYGQVVTSFASFSNHPAVQDAISAFEARRGKDLASGVDAVLAEVNQAQSAAQVRAVTARYLGVPSDRSHDGAMRILAAAGAREQKLASAAARAEEEARSATNLCKPLSSTDVEAGSRGAPSSRDLCLAIASQFDALNDTVRSRAAACRSGGNLRNDPILAFQCIGLCAGAADCEFSMSLTQFQRLACEKAQGVPGFVCTYVIGMSHSNPTIAEVFGSLGASGAVTEARFVQTPNGWIKLQR